MSTVYSHEVLAQQYDGINAGVQTGKNMGVGIGLYCDSCSSWAVVHKSQLAKGSLIVVCKQQLLHVTISLCGLEMTALYDIEVVSFLTFPACIPTCELYGVGCDDNGLPSLAEHTVNVQPLS